MSEYGSIISSSDARSAIYNRNKNTWRQMYAATDLAVQQAESALKQNFASDVAKTYNDYRSQSAAIANSNLGSGYKKQYEAELADAMSEAYNKYLSTYASDVSEVQEAGTVAQQQISDMLTTSGEQTAEYANSTFGYLRWLDETLGPDALQNTELGRYYTDGMLQDASTLRNLMFAYNAETDNYDLTTEGLQYFDLMQNYFATHNPQYSFGNYLATTNQDILDWATAQNTNGLTGAQSFNQLIGLDPMKVNYTTDDVFKYSSENEIDAMFTNFDLAPVADRPFYSPEDPNKSVTENTIDIEQYSKLITTLDTIGGDITGAELKEAMEKYNALLAELPTHVQSETKMTGGKGQAMSTYEVKWVGAAYEDKLRKAEKEVNALFAEVQKIYNQAQQTRIDAGYNKSNTLVGTTTKYQVNNTKAGKTYSLNATNGAMTYIPTSIKADSTIKNEKDSSAEITYNGKKYNVSTLTDTQVLDEADTKVAKALIKNAVGTDAKVGSIIQYNGSLYIFTSDGTFRGIKDQNGVDFTLFKDITANS